MEYINENFDNEIEELKRVLSNINEEPTKEDLAKLKVERHKFKTEVGKQLYDILITISDDDIFLYSVLHSVKGDEKKKLLIEYLKEQPRTKSEVEIIAGDIEIGIYKLDSAEIFDKFITTDIAYRLFHILRDIDLIINNDNENEIDYRRIFRIIFLLETDEDKERLFNTINREIEKRELKFKDFMNLITLGVENYVERKAKE